MVHLNSSFLNTYNLDLNKNELFIGLLRVKFIILLN